MKRNVLKGAFVLLGGMMLLTSCKKDYTCQCTGKGDGDNNTYYEVTETYTFKKAKEDDVKTSCSQSESTLSKENGNISIKCSVSAN